MLGLVGTTRGQGGEQTPTLFLQALLGMAHCLQLSGKPAAALDHINAVIAQQPWFLAALAEKAKLLVAMHEWEQALEVVKQLLQQEPHNVQALHLSGHSVTPRSHIYSLWHGLSTRQQQQKPVRYCCTQVACADHNLICAFDMY